LAKVEQCEVWNKAQKTREKLKSVGTVDDNFVTELKQLIQDIEKKEADPKSDFHHWFR